jgi:DNA-binding CsgD family transcriptional regulator
MKICLYSEDINLLSHWESALGEACIVLESLEEVLALESCCVMLNVLACSNRCHDVLTRLVANGNHVFLLDRAPTLHKAKHYLSFFIKGYGNALMHKNLFSGALDVIKEGMLWLHPELLSELIFELPSKSQNVEAEKLASLTLREREVALMIREGMSYKEMAEHLEVSPRTIKAHAQNIYAKLQVKDRLALALYLS